MALVKNKKKTSEHPNTSDWLPFHRIRNGVVEMKDGRYVKIIEVSPINFILSSRTEKHNIIMAGLLFNIDENQLKSAVNSNPLATMFNI